MVSLVFFENGRKMMAVGFWLYLNLVSGVLMLLQSMLRHLLRLSLSKASELFFSSLLFR